MGSASRMPPDHVRVDEPDASRLLRRRSALRSHPFDGLLFDGVSLPDVGRAVGTPVWILSASVLSEQCRKVAMAFRDANIDARVHYAVKANDGLAVLALLNREGFGADVVSGGEMAKAVRAGIPGSRMIFSGVAKTEEEIEQAIAGRIAQINVESHEELSMVSRIAARLGSEAPIAIRVNPDVAAGTLDKISTGRAGDKFGVSWNTVVALYEAASALPGIRVRGLAVHIGSQVGGGEAFEAAFGRIAALVGELRARGSSVHSVDCGGGLAIPYRGDEGATPEMMAAAIRKTLGHLGVEIAVELGRWLVGPAGILLTRLIRVKRIGTTRPFMIVDAGMNDLIRPALYDAWHGIVPVDPEAMRRTPETVDVVGPVCESSDVFATARALPVGDPGSLYAILDAGAYGSVMSSTYNGRPLAAQVLVDRGRWSVIREPERPESLWRGESVPEWLRD